MDYGVAYIWKSAGGFVYPLLACSILALVVFIERIFALQSSKVMPRELIDLFRQGDIAKPVAAKSPSAGGRILDFFHRHQPSPAALKAYADLEVTQLERGLFVIEIAVSAAPLIGLLGTVMGLVKLFTGLAAECALPNSEVFTQGIALALTTTMLGLCVAIPCIAAHNFLLRRVEVLAAEIEVGVARLISLSSSASHNHETPSKS